MKDTGVVRCIDELGRLVVPKEIRDNLGIRPRDAVEIYVEDGRIILTKSESHCIFCKSGEELCEFEGKLVCRRCINGLSAL
jgi:transcriptional pleiotropic regulator of transition state genes